MAKRSIITKKEIIEGTVFSTRFGGRYYVVPNPKGFDKIMNDINKALYGNLEYISDDGLVISILFFGTRIRAKISINDCFKVND